MPAPPATVSLASMLAIALWSRSAPAPRSALSEPAPPTLISSSPAPASTVSEEFVPVEKLIFCPAVSIWAKSVSLEALPTTSMRWPKAEATKAWLSVMLLAALA